jgi:lactoylglutathione lyase
MNLLGAPIAYESFFAVHFFTVSDQDKSKDFYVRIPGGKGIKPDKSLPDGPTPDKPDVLLDTSSDLNKVNGFLNLRVADI